MLIIVIVAAYIAIGIVSAAVSMKYNVGPFEYSTSDNFLIMMSVLLWWAFGIIGVFTAFKHVVVWAVEAIYWRIR